jgi:hypothetical protein
MVFIISSCKTQDNNLYEFNPIALVKDKITLTGIANDISYIPLDNKYPVNDVFNPKVTKNSIFLFTPNGIIAFNRNGGIARKIGNKGRGPEEYLYGSNFTVDVNHETVYVLDRDNVIKVYNSYGDYIKSIPLQMDIGSPGLIEMYESKIFIAYFLQFNNAKYDWIILDTLGKIIRKKERSIPQFTSNFGAGSGTYLSGKVLHYWNPYVDTIFSILPDLSYKPSFTLSPGEHRLPKSNFNPGKPPNLIMHLRMIFETNRFWVIRYDYIRPIIALVDKNSRKAFLSYIDKDNNSVKDENSGGILNDLDGGINFQPRGYFVEDGMEYLIGLINPYQIKAFVFSKEFINSTPKYSIKKKEFEKLANSLKETDNPVLVMVRLKK